MIIDATVLSSFIYTAIGNPIEANFLLVTHRKEIQAQKQNNDSISLYHHAKKLYTLNSSQDKLGAVEAPQYESVSNQIFHLKSKKHMLFPGHNSEEVKLP